MNANDILTLVRAGFTKEEIMSFGQEAAPDPATITEVNPVADTMDFQPVPPQEMQAEATPPASAELPEALTRALENINGTLAKLQTFAARTDGQPAQPKDTYKDILSSTYNRKENK